MLSVKNIMLYPALTNKE